jgi:hypothetical protein
MALTKKSDCIQTMHEGRAVAFDLASCIMPMLAVPAVSDDTLTAYLRRVLYYLLDLSFLTPHVYIAFLYHHDLDDSSTTGLCRSLCLFLLRHRLDGFPLLQSPLCAENHGLGRLRCDSSFGKNPPFWCHRTSVKHSDPQLIIVIQILVIGQQVVLHQFLYWGCGL